MAKYIELDALVAEINKRIIDAPINNIGHQRVWAYNDVKYIINSLEVKEVDLDFMLHEYWNLSSKITIDCFESATMTKDEMINFAKHFFELGMAVSNKVQKGE